MTMLSRMLLAIMLCACSACATTLPKPVNSLEAIAETEAAIAVAARTATALVDAGKLSPVQAEHLLRRLEMAYDIVRAARNAVGGERGLRVIEAREILDDVNDTVKSVDTGRSNWSFPNAYYSGNALDA